MKLTLHIDTSKSQATVVALRAQGKTLAEKTATVKRAQTALPLIEALLAQEGKTLADLGAIEVETGPGSFTGLRVGLAIAQMLSLLLSIPINGQPAGTAIAPRYDDGGKFDTMDR